MRIMPVMGNYSALKSTQNLPNQPVSHQNSQPLNQSTKQSPSFGTYGAFYKRDEFSLATKEVIFRAIDRACDFWKQPGKGSDLWVFKVKGFSDESVGVISYYADAREAMKRIIENPIDPLRQYIPPKLWRRFTDFDPEIVARLGSASRPHSNAGIPQYFGIENGLYKNLTSTEVNESNALRKMLTQDEFRSYAPPTKDYEPKFFDPNPAV